MEKTEDVNNLLKILEVKVGQIYEKSYYRPRKIKNKEGYILLKTDEDLVIFDSSKDGKYIVAEHEDSAILKISYKDESLDYELFLPRKLVLLEFVPNRIMRYNYYPIPLKDYTRPEKVFFVTYDEENGLWMTIYWWRILGTVSLFADPLFDNATMALGRYLFEKYQSSRLLYNYPLKTKMRILSEEDEKAIFHFLFEKLMKIP